VPVVPPEVASPAPPSATAVPPLPCPPVPSVGAKSRFVSLQLATRQTTAAS